VSDLIERLRDIERDPPNLHERQRIADEIKRLQGAVKYLSGTIATDWAVKLNECKKDNDRLRRELAEAQAEIDEIHATGGTSYVRLEKCQRELAEARSLLLEARDRGASGSKLVAFLAREKP
jgi:chromosome segregation ATPase